MKTKRTREEIDQILRTLVAKHKKPLVYLGFAPLDHRKLALPGIRIIDGKTSPAFDACLFIYSDTEYIVTPDVAKEIGLENYGILLKDHMHRTIKITL